MTAARRPSGPASKRLTPQGRRTLMSSPRAMRHAAPSGELINAVLQYADVSVDLGGGRTLYRLSERRMGDPVIAGPLGREAPRLADVGVIWDEAEDEIFRVLDRVAGDALEAAPTGPAFAEEPRFELTPAALAYLAASGGRA
jgi:hypothetical protein